MGTFPLEVLRPPRAVRRRRHRSRHVSRCGFADAVTLLAGSAGTRGPRIPPHCEAAWPAIRRHLAEARSLRDRCVDACRRRGLVAFDADQAGDPAAERLVKEDRRTCQMRPPDGRNDWNVFLKARTPSEVFRAMRSMRQLRVQPWTPLLQRVIRPPPQFTRGASCDTPAHMSLPRLSNAQARNRFLASHALDRSASGLALPDLIDRLGFVQVDSISTVERAHHMILSARSRPYRPKHLTPHLHRHRTVFEHWTHDASIIPTAFFPHWHLMFRREQARLATHWRKWHGEDFERKLDATLDRIAANGPCMAREVGEDETRSSGGWWEWNPSKAALEFLWRTGRLAVCRREGFQKVYDLTERVIPAGHRGDTPDEAESIDWACNAALDRLGFGTSGEIAGFWDLVRPEQARDWCQANLGSRLIEIEVEGIDGKPRKSFARPDIVDRPSAAISGGVRILSPFDPALRNRNRAERLFGFHFRIEIFVPSARRRYGYYVFPVIERDRLIGRIDMKRTGTPQMLAVTAYWPEAEVRPSRGRLDRIEAEITRIARFSGCEGVIFADGWLREPG